MTENVYWVIENNRFDPPNNPPTERILRTYVDPGHFLFIDNIFSGKYENLFGTEEPPVQIYYDCQNEKTVDYTKEYCSPEQYGGTHGFVRRQYFNGDKDTDSVLVDKAVSNCIGGKIFYTKSGREMTTCCNSDIQVYRNSVDGKIYVGKADGIITGGYVDYVL